MADITVDRTRGTKPACAPAQRVTRSLLGYGVLAGPFYVTAVLAQALFRNGFDLARDDASLLSNGSLGWIQIANFVITGAMVIAFAAGMARALASGRGAAWAPRLLAAYGAGLIGAGVFIADPMNGFPAGAPAGRPDSVSPHGLLHIAFAAVGFLCLVATCILMARRFASERRTALAVFSGVTGALFLIAFAALASGSSSPAVILSFWIALVTVWTWMGVVAVRLYRQVGAG
jgi:hypothetical protein